MSIQLAPWKIGSLRQQAYHQLENWQIEILVTENPWIYLSFYSKLSGKLTTDVKHHRQGSPKRKWGKKSVIVFKISFSSTSLSNTSMLVQCLTYLLFSHDTKRIYIATIPSDRVFSQILFSRPLDLCFYLSGEARSNK
jgi:hypothetical protein